MSKAVRRIAAAALVIVLSAWAAHANAYPFANEKLRVNTDWTDAARTARLCDLADRNLLTPEIKAQCANAFEAQAKRWLDTDPARARNSLNGAVAFGLPSERRAAIDEPLKKIEASAAAAAQRDREKRERERAKRTAERKKEEARKATLVRSEYGKRLREKFLDDGLDIKVKVSGPMNKTITLSYILFNDVWTHKMGKGELLIEMRGLGFTRVNVTDGYDYTVYWDFR